MTETEYQEEIQKLKVEIDRLKSWNRTFYGRVHYYFYEALRPWKEAVQYSEEKRRLTAKCRSIEEELFKEMERVDRCVRNRRVDTPADADKPTAVQTTLDM